MLDYVISKSTKPVQRISKPNQKLKQSYHLESISRIDESLDSIESESNDSDAAPCDNNQLERDSNGEVLSNTSNENEDLLQ